MSYVNRIAVLTCIDIRDSLDPRLSLAVGWLAAVQSNSALASLDIARQMGGQSALGVLISNSAP